MRTVLISCVSKKRPQPQAASEIYCSTWFKYAYQYALNIKAEKIFILSAKYGLLQPGQIIEPYNISLNSMSVAERRSWSEDIICHLKMECDFDKDWFCLLAGKKYRDFLIPNMRYYTIPMEHMGIGEQISFLKNNAYCSDKICVCEELHKLCYEAKRYTYPFDYEEIPRNGIYVLFEKGEYGHGNDRIVRVGTHTGSNQLPSRLKQHFEMENKDRSIFRKNLGRAMLNSENSQYLNVWNLDSTSRENKKNYSQIKDKKIEKEIEKKITNYIQKNFSFILISEECKDKRLALESKIISTVSLCPKCKQSEKWLGNESPIDKIKESGLWQVNELYKDSLSTDDLTYIAEHIVR